MRLFIWILSLFAACAFGEEPLPPEKAFRFSAAALDAATLVVRYEIEPGYYMYRDKFRFEAPPAQLGDPVLPPGKVKDDEFFGKVETYRDRVEIRVPLIAQAGAAPATVTLKATSQGCADIGLCYPPQEQSAQIVLAALGAGSAGPGAAGPVSEDARIARLLGDAGFWVIIATFFGFGLALAFTPCVLPMIPILSGIVVGKGAAITRRKALALTLVYVLGMAITYAIAGVVAGLSGAMLASALQNAWVLAAFASIFVLLALSMFDIYELQLPNALQSWVAERSNRVRGGHMAGVFLMGALSALIVGPCIAPPLAGALLFIAERGEAALGGSALFAMALGMGAPLVGVGASAGVLLPKAGPWMQSVKRFFGVVLLGLAIWILSPVIPAVLHMLAWAALLITCAIYLHALDPLPASASGYSRLWKGIGVIALLAGASLLVGALGGSRDILQPLAGLRFAQPAGSGSAAMAATAPLPFERVATVAELENHLANTAGRPVMLDFYADWCVSCKEMERFTFSDEGVRRRLAGFLLLKADVTANTDADKALLKRYALFGPPGIIFFDSQGREISGLRVIGFQNATRFSSQLDLVTSAEARNVSANASKFVERAGIER